MKLTGIYIIRNTVNGKVYVGQSVDIYHRWSEHRRLLNEGKHVNRHLQSAVNKYGLGAFVFNIIEECSVDFLDEREVFWIERLNSFRQGYNLTSGGEGNRDWKPNRDDFRHLFRRVVCLNTRQEYECLNDAEKETGISAVSISKCCRGIMHYAGVVDGERYVWMFSEDYTSQCLSPSQITQLVSDAQRFSARRATMRAVVCLNTGQRFEALDAAARYAGLRNSSGIHACVTGCRRYAGRHPDSGERLCWVYAEDYVTMNNEECLRRVACANQKKSSGRTRGVVCLNDLHRFQSIGDAAAYYKVPRSSVSLCCSGSQSSVGVPSDPRCRLLFAYSDNWCDLSVEEIRLRIETEVRKYGRQPGKPVRCLNTGVMYESAKIAAEFSGTSAACIQMACRGVANCAGRHPTTGEKLYWEYVNDALPDSQMAVAS